MAHKECANAMHTQKEFSYLKRMGYNIGSRYKTHVIAGSFPHSSKAGDIYPSKDPGQTEMTKIYDTQQRT